MKRRSLDVVAVQKKTKTNLTTSHLSDAYYDHDCFKLARSLLGKKIVRKVNDRRLACKIVEVESYLANDDKSSHSYQHKKTKRNEAMFMKPGTLYVYLTYGMYHCMNISSKGDGDAVLIRAAEPMEGVDLMLQNRQRLSKSNKLFDKGVLCNGPSKLCQALDIGLKQNKLNLCNSSELWLEEFERIPEDTIVHTKRIGLNVKRVGEWAMKPLRFYILGNGFVSKKDYNAEKEMAVK
uniref:DNA-3-methyladenine glycosylase n=1 Tax=Phallusia mammillata TaxID=59560 RepID=A0A6F9DLR6_9ASCI|nr:probable DNA-3-methyladenine glycosylase [Phallusia mammillata]